MVTPRGDAAPLATVRNDPSLCSEIAIAGCTLRSAGPHTLHRTTRSLVSYALTFTQHGTTQSMHDTREGESGSALEPQPRDEKTAKWNE